MYKKSNEKWKNVDHEKTAKQLKILQKFVMQKTCGESGAMDGYTDDEELADACDKAGLKSVSYTHLTLPTNREV